MSNTKPRTTTGANLYDSLYPGWEVMVPKTFTLSHLIALLGGRQETIKKLGSISTRHTSNNRLMQGAGLEPISKEEPNKYKEIQGLLREWHLRRDARLNKIA